MPHSPPTKTYTITTTSCSPHSKTPQTTICHNSTTIFHSTSNSSNRHGSTSAFSTRDCCSVLLTSASDPPAVVAACTTKRVSRTKFASHLALGDPDAKELPDKDYLVDDASSTTTATTATGSAAGSTEPGSEITSPGITGKKFFFSHAGRSLTWVRTHSKELGAHRFGYRDYKLVDEGAKANGAQAEEAVLAVYRLTGGSYWTKGTEEAVVEWFGEMGEETELLALVAIVAIEEGIRKGEEVALFYS